MPFDTEVMLAAPLIIVAGFLIFGISGFGSALISIPLLAHFLPLTEVVPMMVLLDFAAAFLTGVHGRSDVVWKEVRPMLGPMAAGIAAGVWLLHRAPQALLVSLLGVFVLGYGLTTLARKHRPVEASVRWALPSGFAGGTMGAMFGVGGPVYVAYLSARLHEPAQFRATLSVVFAFGTITRIALFAVSGLLLNAKLWLAAAGLLPFMLLGTVIGRRIHLRLSRSAIAQVIGVLLVASGLSLLWRALAAP